MTIKRMVYELVVLIIVTYGMVAAVDHVYIVQNQIDEYNQRIREHPGLDMGQIILNEMLEQSERR